MEHPEQRDAIEAYVEGMLPLPARQQLESHLERCASCTRYLDTARAEADLLRRALAPAAPPRSLAAAVSAQLPARRRAPLRGALAGIAANLLTAAVLVSLSLGAGVNPTVTILAGLAVAVVWGGLKGLAFGLAAPALPRSVWAQGLLFGAVLWLAANAALVAVGALSGGTAYSAGFVLAGGAVHDVAYGLLLSWLFRVLRNGVPARPGLSAALHAVVPLALLAVWVMPGPVAGAPVRLPQPTASAEPVPTDSATTTVPATPTVPPSATAAVPTATALSTVTLLSTPAATPVPTAPPVPTARAAHTSSPLAVRQQVHTIVHDALAPSAHLPARVRTRSVVVLVRFL